MASSYKQQRSIINLFHQVTRTGNEGKLRNYGKKLRKLYTIDDICVLLVFMVFFCGFFRGRLCVHR